MTAPWRCLAVATLVVATNAATAAVVWRERQPVTTYVRSVPSTFDRDELVRCCTLAERRVAQLQQACAGLSKDLADTRAEHAVQRSELKECNVALTAIWLNEERRIDTSILSGPRIPAVGARVLGVQHDVAPELALVSAGSD